MASRGPQGAGMRHRGALSTHRWARGRREGGGGAQGEAQYWAQLPGWRVGCGGWMQHGPMEADFRATPRPGSVCVSPCRAVCGEPLMCCAYCGGGVHEGPRFRCGAVEEESLS